ncbi:MAG: sugar phosphate isomerase/epimerase [Bryobacteraceae bacterium]|nr:sugar phosphate isomerase/epimerase [Bryobacteraceae bacterium]
MLGTRLLHSVSYAGLWGQHSLPVDDFVDHAAALGFGGVMLMAKRPHVSPLDYDPAQRLALRQRLERHRLTDLVIAGYTNLTADLEHAEIPHREFQVSYIVELAKLTRDLGGTRLRVFTGYEHASAAYGSQWKLIVETLREAAGRAGDLGVTLGVQNHHDVAVGWQQFADLLRAVDHPHCRAMFDAWAPALHGEPDLATPARHLAPDTIHTTVADYQRRPRYRYNAALVNYEPATPLIQAVPMGEGFIDYRAFLGGLAAGGSPATVAYEMCSPLREGGARRTLDAYATRFLEYMQELQ